MTVKRRNNRGNRGTQPSLAGRESGPKQNRAGKIDENTKFDSSDFRNTVPRFSAEARQANQALVDLIGKFAEQKGATPAQIALAWVLAQMPWIVPIPGTTKLHRLAENLGAVDVELTAGDLDELDRLTSQVKVQGARYGESSQRLVNR